MRTTMQTLIQKTRVFLATFLLLAAQMLAPVSAFIPTASAAPVCVSDTAGANDEPGQKDLTQKCEESAPPAGTEVISWNWDDRGTTGGGQSLDACGLFDSDGDTFINFSICVTTEDDPATLDTVTIYTCTTDSKTDRCTGPDKIEGSYSTTCTVSQQNTDPFAAGNLYPLDTVASCNFVLSDLPGAISNLVFTDVCSYPSREPNSDPSDCVIIQPDPVALVEVIKDLTPSNDSGLFNLTVNGPGSADDTTVVDRTDGGTTGIVSVHPTANDNDVTVSEAAGTGTSLSDYDSSVECVDRGTTNVIGSGVGHSLTFEVSDGDDIVCTISNTLQNGSITIVKNTDGGDGTFNFTGDLGAFSLNTVSGTDSDTFDDLAPDTYSVAETVPEGWDLTSATCDDGSEVDAIELSAGETVECTFTNVKHGQLIVQKTTDPAGNSTEFTITASTANGEVIGSAEGTITDATDHTYTVKPGTYSVAETVPGGWKLIDNGCQNVEVAAGETVYCTITNGKLAKLTIVKEANPEGDQIFTFTPDWTGVFSLDDDGDNTNALKNFEEFTLEPDTYAVAEGAPEGWRLTGINCAGGSPQYGENVATVTLGYGDEVTCTFTNTKLGSISGYKWEVNSTGSHDNDDGLSDWEIQLFVNGGLYDTTTTDTDGSFLFSGLLPDDYEVKEVNQSGWTQIVTNGTTCDSETHMIDLSAGENSVDNDFCNFENGDIPGYKFNDLNGDGTKQENEPKLPDWPFSYTYDANGDGIFNETPVNFTTDETGNFLLEGLAPGKYQICEDPQTELGWVRTTPVSSNCRDRTIDDSNETVSQAIFGNQGRGTIRVNKDVDTDDDGLADVTGATNWTWDYTGLESDSNVYTGNKIDVAAGSYSIHEDQKTDFHFVSVACTGESELNQGETVSITVSPGEDVVCTFTNSRDTGWLKVVKDVVNNNSGNKTYTDFHFTLNGGEPYSFVQNTSPDGHRLLRVLTGTYDVVEPEANTMDYTTTYMGCEDMVVTTQSTEENPVTCTITNDDISRPGVKIEKTGPETAHEGDKITFEGKITNTGNAPLSIAGVTDNVAGSVTIVTDESGIKGDANDNDLLDVDETWYGTVKYTVPEGQEEDIVNTMTVCADDATDWYKSARSSDSIDLSILVREECIPESCTSENPKYDTCDDDSHVTDILHPALQVIKSGPGTAMAGSTVTYTFTVTNTGDTPLEIVTVEDSIAGKGIYQSGDTDEDNLLDLTETWVYSADYTIPADQKTGVKNTVIVCGMDQLEMEVCDSDDHSLTVPQVLADTGTPISHGTWIGLAILSSLIGLTWFSRRRSEA